MFIPRSVHCVITLNILRIFKLPSWYLLINTVLFSLSEILLTEEEDKQLILWENLNQDDYVRNSQIQKKAELNNQVCATHEM